MELIIETNGISGLAFKHYRNNELIKYVMIDGFVKEINEIHYFILIDSYGRILEDAYKYLNVKLGGESYKKRELAFTALKLLYSYIYLFNLISPESIDQKNISKFDEFLEGGIRKSANFEFRGKTIRSNSTINKYYTTYRHYYNYLKITNNIFEELKGKRYVPAKNEGFFAHTYSPVESMYSISKTEVISNEVPKFISLVEYYKILNYIKTNLSLREELIVILLYEYGMRIGEVLGLTVEDILGANYTKDDYGKLIIRNRYTDKRYQWAKGCMKIVTRNTYNKPEYHQIGLGKEFGCESIKISIETLQKLQKYISLTRSPDFFGVKAYNNMKMRNTADKVTDRVDIQKNSYVFVNKNGTALSDKGWGDILKQIYIDLDIELDKEKKKDGLSHRFRHGFAMFNVLIEKCDRLELKNLLRHTNIRSCEIYFSLTSPQKSELVQKAFTLQKEGGMQI